MNVHQIRILGGLLLCLTAAVGCNQSNDAEVARLKAEVNAANSKAETEVAKAKADAEIAKLKAELDAAKAAQAQPTVVDENRKAAEWVLSVGGNLAVTHLPAMRVLADGKTVDIFAKDGKLPDGPFEVESVNLIGNNKVTDQGIQCLGGLTKVRELYLNGATPIDNFAFLKPMRNLRILNAIGQDLMDDTSLANLAGLTRLTNLEIHTYGENSITDAGLEHLTGMIDLRLLYILGTRVTDAGIEKLKTLPGLEALGIGSYLGKSQISDAGLKHISSIPGLKRLIIVTTEISDSGMEHLKNLSHLELLVLEKTKITQAGVASLKTVLPKCEIQVK